ncbi:MAG: hypothetical protein H8E00_01090 [Deltaproteobacteria bacterium]|nr:hypothetical protein [Deltaproteobacteria bacterium]
MSTISKNKGLIIFIGVVLIFGMLFWYFFIDTLSLTEVTGQPKNPIATIFVNLIDFDTGLTRYDIYNLASKSEYWERRIRQVNLIRNPQQREIENQKLLAEMIQDPSIKKIAKKLLGFSTGSAIAILRAAKAFSY